MNSRTQRGASMVELIISLPMFLMLIFIIAELSLMHQAKSILDMAALAAARAGAINHGSPGVMRNAAMAAMAPLYAPGTGTTLAAMAKSVADNGVPHAIGSTSITHPPGGIGPQFNSTGGGSLQGLRVEILSPTRQMVQDFGVSRNYLGGSDSSTKYKVIPNDNLMYRDTKLRNNVNVQDANLLKIRVTYLYKTRMPMTRYFFTPLMNANLTSVMFGGEAPGNTADVPEGWRVPLVSYVTVRMQSDFKEESLSAAATGSDGGSGWGSSSLWGGSTSTGGEDDDPVSNTDDGSSGGDGDDGSDDGSVDTSGDPDPPPPCEWTLPPELSTPTAEAD